MSTIPRPASGVSGDRIPINGMRMYYEVSGAGEPLVVLHGAFMNIPLMGAIVPRLAEHHRVYALELQGHGRTTDIDRPITYPALADDVAAFMDAVGLASADVFGFSMGGQTGLQLAIRHPDKVRRLVAASPVYDRSGWQPAFGEAVRQLTVEMIVGMPFAARCRELADDPDGLTTLAGKMVALMREPLSWEADVRTLKAPVLIITGDADLMTLEHSVMLFRLLGGGDMGEIGQPRQTPRLAVLPATPHAAVITRTELLRELIEPFLAGDIPVGYWQQQEERTPSAAHLREADGV